MAEAKPVYLYPLRADNDKLKAAASDAGVKIKFDREVGAYQMQTDGMSKQEVTAAKKTLGDYVGKAAKTAWQKDREAGLAEKEALRSAAKAREGTTKEPKPEKAPVNEENRYLMFPAHSQKAEFRTLVRETQSESRFMPANANREAHYSVKTEVPEKFAAYMGDAARERFVREHAERGEKPQAVNTAVERAREEAERRAGTAFMAQYKDRGFRLKDSQHDKEGHQKQLDEMRSATTPQLLAVIRKSREIMEPLRDKEAGLRAEAAGISVEQVKAMSFADQKAIAQVDGKPVGLVGEDFKLNAQLSRGIAAINAELNGRGVRQKNAERSQGREGNEHGQKQPEKSGYAVSQEQSVDNDYAVLAAGFARRGGRSR